MLGSWATNEPGAFDSQIAIEKFKVYLLLGLDEILTELVQLGDKKMMFWNT